MADLGIAEAVQSLVTDFTGLLTEVGPIILGAIAVFIGLNLGIKVIKKMTAKVG